MQVGAAFDAAAAFGFDVRIEIGLAVVVAELLASFDVSPRENKYTRALLVYLRLAVWAAGVVDIARCVTARRAIERFCFTDLKKIERVGDLLLLVAEDPARVLDDTGAFGYSALRVQPKPRLRALDFELILPRFKNFLHEER